MKTLMIGAGHRAKRPSWIAPVIKTGQITTLDINPLSYPDIVWDLNNIPYTFANDNEYDHVIATEVLEHCGTQGDYKFFFGQFEELWRIVKPGGYIIGTVPTMSTLWVFGDPGHTRYIGLETLQFLDQTFYDELGAGPKSDYRFCYNGNLKLVDHSKWADNAIQSFILEVKK